MNFDLHDLEDPVKKNEFIAIAMDALNVIYTLVGGSKTDNAVGVLTILRLLLKNVEEAYKGDVSPKLAKEEFKKLLDAIASTDENIDAAIKKKFGEGDEP